MQRPIEKILSISVLSSAAALSINAIGAELRTKIKVTEKEITSAENLTANQPMLKFDSPCSMQDLTFDCRIYDQLPPVIVMPDGTSFPNPVKPKEKNPEIAPDSGFSNSGYYIGDGYGVNKLDDDGFEDKAIQAEARLAEAIDRLAKNASSGKEQKISNAFKVAFIRKFPQISARFVYNPGAGKFESSNDYQVIANSSTFSHLKKPLKMPWPANSTSTEYSTLSTQDEAKLLELLNSADNSTKQEMGQQLNAVHGNLLKIAKDDAYLAAVKAQDLQEEKEKQEKEENRKKHIKDLVALAKEAIVKKLSGGKSLDSLPSDVQNLIKKVSSVRYREMNPKNSEELDNCKSPNAYYSSTEHTFLLCPSIMNYPDSQLIEIIGHELGHSIDPCRSMAGVSKVNSELVKNFRAKDMTSSSSEDDKALEDLTDRTTTALPIAIYFTERFQETIRKYKILTTEIDGVDPSKYPLKNAVACMQKKANLNDISKSDIDLSVETWVELAKARGASKADLLKEKEAAKKLLSLNPSCTGSFDKVSEMTESSADMWGAIAQAEYFKKFRPRSNLDRIAAISLWKANGCVQIEKLSKPDHSTPDSIAKQLRRLTSKKLESQYDKMDPHPKHEIRTDEVMFSYPPLAEAMGCKVGPNSGCYQLLEEAFKQKPEVSSRAFSAKSKSSTTPDQTEGAQK